MHVRMTQRSSTSVAETTWLQTTSYEQSSPRFVFGVFVCLCLYVRTRVGMCAWVGMCESCYARIGRISLICDCVFHRNTAQLLASVPAEKCQTLLMWAGCANTQTHPRSPAPSSCHPFISVFAFAIPRQISQTNLPWLSLCPIYQTCPSSSSAMVSLVPGTCLRAGRHLGRAAGRNQKLWAPNVLKFFCHGVACSRDVPPCRTPWRQSCWLRSKSSSSVRKEEGGKGGEGGERVISKRVWAKLEIKIVRRLKGEGGTRLWGSAFLPPIFHPSTSLSSVSLGAPPK